MPAHLVTMISLVREGYALAVVTNWYPLGLLLGVATILVDADYLIVCHGVDVLAWRRNRVFHRLMIWALLRARAVVCVSRYTKRIVLDEGLPADAVSVVHPGVTPLEWPGKQPPSDLRLLLTVGRLVPRKGIADAIESLPPLARDHPIRYIVAGDGPELERLRSLAGRLGVSGSVSFVGKTSEGELCGLYASSDVFILPSRSGSDPTQVEGFGIVLLEAQMMGLPVVATRTGGIPEAVLEDRTAILVAEGSPTEIGAAVRTLLEDRARAARMGRTSAKWAGRFGWGPAARSILDKLSSEGPGQGR